MTVLNPEYEFKWKDLWWVIPSMVNFPPLLFWFIELILLIIFFWWFIL